jgi:hypothetical protein
MESDYTVATYHGESKTLHYVLDPDGDPVDSYSTREAAERAAWNMNATRYEEDPGDPPR